MLFRSGFLKTNHQARLTKWSNNFEIRWKVNILNDEAISIRCIQEGAISKPLALYINGYLSALIPSDGIITFRRKLPNGISEISISLVDKQKLEKMKFDEQFVLAIA